jgi:hypothetical protein
MARKAAKFEKKRPGADRKRRGVMSLNGRSRACSGVVCAAPGVKRKPLKNRTTMRQNKGGRK